MSEITKYMVTGLGINLANNSIIAGYDEVTDCEQPICMWSDVEPIIQRNKELEAELARLREQEPEYYVSTEEERDIALNTLAEMFESAEESEGEDGMLMSVDISLWNEGCEALEVLIGGEDDVEPKPAQDISSWMVDDDIGTNLCDVCGNPVRYGSRHHMCGQDFKDVIPAINAQIPAELVEWANNDEPNLEMDDSADVALEKIVRNECRAFVRSQLEKMKGKP
jgi:hypothetical protein